ncbi:hypothetical protein BR93DRAFT_856956, partial [Coniochaeta sp. PMI_546]
PTVVPYVPSPPSPSTSTSDLYGPDRHQHFGPPITVPNPNYSAPRLPPLPRTAVENLVPSHAMDPTSDLQGRMNADMLTSFRDELVREAGVVTPGVDDTPYIQFAIEALTRDRDTGYSGNDSLSSDETLSGHRAIPDQGLGYYQPTPAIEQQRRTYSNAPRISDSLHGQSQYGRSQGRSEMLHPNTPRHPSDEQQSRSHFGFSPQAQAAAWNDGSMLTSKSDSRPTRPDEAVPVDRDHMTGAQPSKETNGLPHLHYRPWLLRSASFVTLLLLCILMVAALIFSAIYSATRNGLVAYADSGGQYFLFRVLPQLLAAVIVIYTECIVAAMFRILPFVRLASRRSEERERAIYMDLYPGHTLWPKLIDKWEMWMFVFVSWLINLTLPLQSSLFTPILVGETWTWGTVQGVVWTLVALYIVLIVSTIITLVEWTKITQTGLIWDPKSLADLIMMVSDTNVASQYKGTELASHRSTIGFALRHRNIERLGYWSGKDGREQIYYAIRSLESDNPRHSGYTREKAPSDGDYVYDTRDRDLEASTHRQAVRYGHLPWCLLNNQLIFSVVAATVLLVALFVVSFLPSTRITDGFPPGLPSHPVPGGFSAANFLYSFLPSLLGLILYLLFQSLDLSFRILQPWAALADSRGGTTGTSARKSLLADYASCLPLQSTLHALRNGHYCVAALSLLSTLFILLPVLGGGIFMALTDPSTHEVRMFPSLPVYSIVLALLVLYLVGLVATLPFRHDFRLPHGVTCLAEILGYLVNEDLLRERCFKGVRSRAEMLAKMGVGRRGDDGGRWMLSEGSDGVLGVRRVARFTEKRRVRKSQIRR